MRSPSCDRGVRSAGLRDHVGNDATLRSIPPVRNRISRRCLVWYQTARAVPTIERYFARRYGGRMSAHPARPALAGHIAVVVATVAAIATATTGAAAPPPRIVNHVRPSPAHYALPATNDIEIDGD